MQDDPFVTDNFLPLFFIRLANNVHCYYKDKKRLCQHPVHRSDKFKISEVKGMSIKMFTEHNPKPDRLPFDDIIGLEYIDPKSIPKSYLSKVLLNSELTYCNCEVVVELKKNVQRANEPCGSNDNDSIDSFYSIQSNDSCKCNNCKVIASHSNEVNAVKNINRDPITSQTQGSSSNHRNKTKKCVCCTLL